MADPCLTDFMTSTVRDAILKRLREVKAELDVARAPDAHAPLVDESRTARRSPDNIALRFSHPAADGMPVIGGTR